MADFEDLDYYELLGVPRSASAEEIKRAYRREIAKYHPDRYVGAAPAEQQYASRRAQRLTEAYAVLSDFSARSSYNLDQRSQQRRPASTPRPAPPPPPQQRDHQAELYDQARAHLDAGRLVQAIGVLRQLQQINPFYRDSADLLASSEAQLRARRSSPARPRLMRPLVIAGAAGGLVVASLLLWALTMRTTSSAAGTALPAAVAPSAPPTAAPAPTDVPTTVPPTPAPSPSLAPTSPPSSTPQPPTATPSPQPPTVAPSPTGALLLADDFAGDGWASLSGASWSVGYASGRYRIAAGTSTGAIWSYRTAPQADLHVAVDVQAPAGQGGLLLRFVDENNYLTFTIDPLARTYHLEQQRRGTITQLAVGTSDVIRGGEETNRIEARLRGSQISIAVNGRPLADVEAPGAADSQRFGLVAFGGAAPAEVLFDNLEIRTIE